MLKQKNGISYASSSLLESGTGMRHGFLTRLGGVSKAPFSSLNFDPRDGDDITKVKQNKIIAGKAFGFDASRLLTINQVHGTDVLVVDMPVKDIRELSRTSADAIITNQHDLAVGVLTADCVPVILADPGKRVMGIVHAGWRGTLKGIVQKALDIMIKKFGSVPGTILSAIGPSIGQCCYAVDDAVAEAFMKTFSNYDAFLNKKSGWKLDLKRVNRIQLLSRGILEKNITTEDLCTSCRNDLFFSYRADKKGTGRQLNFIMLKEI